MAESISDMEDASTHFQSSGPRVSPTSLEPDDGDAATEYEIRTLVHVVDTVPFRTWIVCFLAGCERFVWYAATTPLQNYIQHAPGGELPGALGLGQSTASNIVNALMIAVHFIPIPAAVLADGHGRYKTMVVAAAVEALGATLLFATSLPQALQSGAGLPGLIVACILLAVGSGAFKTAAIPFSADQYDKTDHRIKTLKSGKKCVTSRDLTITFIYNAYYWGENIGATIADANPFIERYVEYWPTYLIPSCIMWVTTVALLLSKTKFVSVLPTLNVMPQVAAALWYAILGGFKMDAASPTTQWVKHNRVVPWTEEFIHEIQSSLQICRLFLLCPILWLCFNQTFNNLISQAGQMVTYGIPNDSIKVAGSLANIIAAPIIQKGLYPFLENHRIYFGPVARMAVGFLLLCLAMCYTAVLQHFIYSTGPCYDRPVVCPAGGNEIPNQISVFLQIPIYVLGEVALIFFCTTGTEYAYNKAPQSMKCVLQAVWFAMAGIGSCFALAFNALAYDPQLVIMYSVLTGLLSFSTVIFWFSFKHLDKKGEKEHA